MQVTSIKGEYLKSPVTVYLQKYPQQGEEVNRVVVIKGVGFKGLKRWGEPEDMGKYSNQAVVMRGYELPILSWSSTTIRVGVRTGFPDPSVGMGGEVLSITYFDSKTDLFSYENFNAQQICRRSNCYPFPISKAKGQPRKTFRTRIHQRIMESKKRGLRGAAVTSTSDSKIYRTRTHEKIVRSLGGPGVKR